MTNQTIDLPAHQMLALGRGTLSALREALLRDYGPDATEALREAGFAGGGAVFRAFRDRVMATLEREPDELTTEEFAAAASEYFSAAGWGALSLHAIEDAVATVDSSDWGEANPESGLDHPGCHLTTGMFADFFGRVSPVPLAVLEVECRSAGAPRCRFLLADGEVMTYIFDALERDGDYQAAIARMA